MRYAMFGRTGLYVSELCFGSMTFGGGPGIWEKIGNTAQDEADRLVGVALDAGINFFDTADVYSEGASERILGKALGARRKDVVVASKVRGRMGPGVNDVGLSRAHIMRSIDATLQRLGTDWLDLYQIHGHDPVTPIDETHHHRCQERGAAARQRRCNDVAPHARGARRARRGERAAGGVPGMDARAAGGGTRARVGLKEANASAQDATVTGPASRASRRPCPTRPQRAAAGAGRCTTRRP